MKDQKGFSVIEIVLVLAVIGLLVFLGMRIMNQKVEPAPTSDSTSQQSEEIENEQDLQDAESELNSTDIEELDTSELDAAEDELL